MAARNDKGVPAGQEHEVSGEDLVELYNAALREPTGFLPEGMSETIEAEFTGAGNLAVSRRMATAFLEKPFSEMAGKILADRDTAVAIEHASQVLDGHIERYERLVEWIKTAKVRMMFAVAARDDGDAIRAEVKSEIGRQVHEEAAHG